MLAAFISHSPVQPHSIQVKEILVASRETLALEVTALETIRDLGGDWFFRYHPQTQLLRLVTVVGGLQQSLESL